jgi:hypothetical protein
VYDYIVEVDTEFGADFVKNLIITEPAVEVWQEGPQGPQGIQGEIGPQGVKGDKGDTGDTTPADSNASTTWTGNVSLGYSSPVTRTRTLAGNTTVTALSAGTTGVAYTATLVIKQAASGGPYTLTWPASIEWANDAPAPIMPTTANSEQIIHLFWTGWSWRAILGGVFYP